MASFYLCKCSQLEACFGEFEEVKALFVFELGLKTALDPCMNFVCLVSNWMSGLKMLIMMVFGGKSLGRYFCFGYLASC